MKYHKIQTVWTRDPDNNYRTLIAGAWARPEFDYLRDLDWEWTEKVDGTNIRVAWDGEVVRFGGKTERAQIPTFLLDKLQERFTPTTMKDMPAMTLYGEGFGARIQKGGDKYIPDGVDFVLFDVWSAGLWLQRSLVYDIAHKLSPWVVPVVGQGSLTQMVDVVSGGIKSAFGDFAAEGLVARPLMELQDRRGERIITKLKITDFSRGATS